MEVWNKVLGHMDSFLDTYGTRIGRILMGLLFLIVGVASLIGFEDFKQYTGSVLPIPAVFAVLAIIFKIGGGLGLVLGIRVRIATATLIFFTLLATILFHLKGMFGGDPTHLSMTLKNIAIIGGLLLVAQRSAPAVSKTEGI